MLEDILTMTDAELDLYIAENETDFNGDLRGRAYKRVQRRNKIAKRLWLEQKVLPKAKYKGMYAKNHDCCHRANCYICHSPKVYKKPTKAERQFNEKMKYELIDLYITN